MSVTLLGNPLKTCHLSNTSNEDVQLSVDDETVEMIEEAASGPSSPSRTFRELGDKLATKQTKLTKK